MRFLLKKCCPFLVSVRVLLDDKNEAGADISQNLENKKFFVVQNYHFLKLTKS